MSLIRFIMKVMALSCPLMRFPASSSETEIAFCSIRISQTCAPEMVSLWIM